MQEKKLFIEPELEIVRFSKQDIITTSGEEEDKPITGGGGGIVLPDDNW